MSYNDPNIAVDVLRARLQNALEFVAAMVSDRDDGDVYLSIFIRLENELATIQQKETAIERAKRLARAKSL
jgi:hypothetical protein